MSSNHIGAQLLATATSSELQHDAAIAPSTSNVKRQGSHRSRRKSWVGEMSTLLVFIIEAPALIVGMCGTAYLLLGNANSYSLRGWICFFLLYSLVPFLGLALSICGFFGPQPNKNILAMNIVAHTFVAMGNLFLLLVVVVFLMLN